MLVLALTLAGAAGEPAFAYRPEVDLPVTAVAGVVAAGWLLRHQLSPAWCSPRCDPDKLNPLDRATAGRFRPAFSTASDVTLAVVLVGSLGLPFVDEGGGGLTDALVVAETVLLGNALAAVSSTGVRRPRPFMYGDEAPVEERMDGNGSLSFFSGHTVASFAAVTTAFGIVARRHPGSAARWVTLAVGLLGASIVGAGRILAGQHFTTDVLAGAAVGASLGVLVPALHDRPLTVMPTAVSGGPMLVLSGRF